MNSIKEELAGLIKRIDNFLAKWSILKKISITKKIASKLRISYDEWGNNNKTDWN